ncbi:hypothetical protein FA15DRAFT_673119 [Coprinopsis marcescibilis]|uniref:Uncharacterized protein n=1 Tax=Coprinopsis marcescibilis TaxID=230819 RepID=A0A5C3KKF0_COPMA|nr:hypothetical protein FA15DRAFT_673119 [Coprinopsis marcescibilis]
MLVNNQPQQTINGGLEITNRGTYLTTISRSLRRRQTLLLLNVFAPESGLASCGGGYAKMAVGLMGRGSIPYQPVSTR